MVPSTDALWRLRRDLATAPAPVEIIHCDDAEPPPGIFAGMSRAIAESMRHRPGGRRYWYVRSPDVVDVLMFHHDDTIDAEVLVVELADRAQQLVILDSPPQGRTWPVCPAHRTHPLWPEVRDRRATWACRHDPDTHVPIGDLAGMPPSSG